MNINDIIILKRVRSRLNQDLLEYMRHNPFPGVLSLKDKVLIDGLARYECAKELGITDVPVRQVKIGDFL